MGIFLKIPMFFNKTQFNPVFLCFSSWVKPYKTGWVKLGWVFCANPAFQSV